VSEEQGFELGWSNLVPLYLMSSFNLPTIDDTIPSDVTSDAAGAGNRSSTVARVALSLPVAAHDVRAATEQLAGRACALFRQFDLHACPWCR
jgi:hypothetical protein